MDYKKLVAAAGYKGDVADYITRKLTSRRVPRHKLGELTSYFPRSPRLAGVELAELGSTLAAAADAIDKSATETTKKEEPTAKKDTAVKDGK